MTDCSTISSIVAILTFDVVIAFILVKSIMYLLKDYE